MNWSIVLPISIFIAGTAVTLLLRRLTAAAAERAALDKRIVELESKLSVLGVQISPLWAAVQSKIAKDLTHPSPQFHEMDELLRRLEALTITDSERERLHTLLIERTESTDAEVSDAERKSAALMIGIMDKVLKEAANEGPVVEPQLIGVKQEESKK